MQLNNFNGVMMVLNSLFSEPVMKLSLTWKVRLVYTINIQQIFKLLFRKCQRKVWTCYRTYAKQLWVKGT